MATTQDQYYQQYIKDVGGAIRGQTGAMQEDQYNYIQGLAQRMGIGAAMQHARDAAAPWAKKAADAVAAEAARGKQHAQRQAEFEKQQANWEQQFGESKRQFDAQQAMRNREMQMQWALAMMEHGGMGPGYGGPAYGPSGGTYGMAPGFGMPGGLPQGAPGQMPFGGVSVMPGGRRMNTFGTNPKTGRNVMWERAMRPGGGTWNKAARYHNAWLQNLYS
jgi:hypothetical protein